MTNQSGSELGVRRVEQEIAGLERRRIEVMSSCPSDPSYVAAGMLIVSGAIISILGLVEWAKGGGWVLLLGLISISVGVWSIYRLSENKSERAQIEEQLAKLRKALVEMKDS
jgi:glucose uptake protein GlcU